MFGISAFSQTPFSSLAGKLFAESPIENVGVTDIRNTVATFLQSKTENINVNEINADDNSFFALINEFVGMADVKTIIEVSTVSQLETLRANDTPLISAQFKPIRIEPTSLNDILYPYFAALQSRTEPVSMNDIRTIIAALKFTIAENINLNELETVTAASQSSIIEALQMLDDQFPRGWIRINDSQVVTWTQVNNTQ